MILGKSGSGDSQETLNVITARREKLERAVRRIPAFSFEEKPVLDIVETFSKAKLKRKIRQMKAFGERTISSSSTEGLKITEEKPKNIIKNDNENMKSTKPATFNPLPSQNQTTNNNNNK